MVFRKLNKPIVKVGAYPVFWMREVGSNWHCRKCNKQQKANSVSVEMCVRFAGKGLKPSMPMQTTTESMYKKYAAYDDYNRAVKLYLCFDCAESLLSESIDHIRLCRTVGPEGYMVFTEKGDDK
jgi:hypothetical protein